jgi:hypothetical protein
MTDPFEKNDPPRKPYRGVSLEKGWQMGYAENAAENGKLQDDIAILQSENEGLRIWKDVALASKDVLLETTYKLDKALEFLRDMQWQYEPVMQEQILLGELGGKTKYRLVKTWYCPICDAQAIEDTEKKHNPDCTLDAFLKDNETEKG